MKHTHIKSGLMLVSFMISLFFAGCGEKEDYMDAGVVDMNSRITNIDKLVTQPGDVVTVTGSNLDKVYKILLNDLADPVVSFTATSSSELKFTIPAAANTPLGDVVTVNFLFSGKGLASKAIRIISPPQIYEISPQAAQPGDVVTLNGQELHLSQIVRINGVDVTSTLEIISDRIVTVVTPGDFTGGDVTIQTESGGISTSPYPIILGREIMINNFDGVRNYNRPESAGAFISRNGNIAPEENLERGDFPRNNFHTFTLTDRSTGWGGNIDFYTAGLPADITDLTKVTLSIDIRLTKAINVNVMIARGSDVWGKTLPLVIGWQTVKLKFSDMGSGYGGTIPLDMPLPAFNDISGVKIQPPAQTADGNFGENISIDNIKFIIED